jgi:hypothetical protein
MTNFPLLIVVTMVSTQWQNFSGDFHREGGSNLIHQFQTVTTNVQVLQISLCTNRLATTEVASATNGVQRWVAATPPLPGQPSKE